MDIPINQEHDDLPILYWISNLHKTIYREKYMMVPNNNCLWSWLIFVSVVREGLKSYCDKVYPHSNCNEMWILKNSKDLLDNFYSRFF